MITKEQTWKVAQAQDADFEGWLVLAKEVEDLFGPLVKNAEFISALRKNIARGSAFCVRPENRMAGAPISGGLLWSDHSPNYRISWIAVAGSCRRSGVAEALVHHVLRTISRPAEVWVTT